MALAEQLNLPIPKPPKKYRHGGKRKNAGRKSRTGQRGHLPRPPVSARFPLHVTLKLREDLPSLRRKDAFRCFRESVKRARRQGLSVSQFAILSNHIHLLVEAEDNRALAKMFRSLGISFTKRVNALTGKKGSAFQDRFHLHVLKTPTEVRNVIRYILGNENKHREGAAWFKAPMPARIHLDRYSSAFKFSEWKALFGAGKICRIRYPQLEHEIRKWLGEILNEPKTWLAREGWKHA